MNTNFVTMLTQAIEQYKGITGNRGISDGGDYFRAASAPKPGDIIRLWGKVVVVKSVSEPEEMDYNYSQIAKKGDQVCEVLWREATTEEKVSFVNFDEKFYAVLWNIRESWHFWHRNPDTLANIVAENSALYWSEKDDAQVKIARTDGNTLVFKDKYRVAFDTKADAEKALLFCQHEDISCVTAHFGTLAEAELFLKRCKAESAQGDDD